MTYFNDLYQQQIQRKNPTKLLLSIGLFIVLALIIAGLVSYTRIPFLIWIWGKGLLILTVTVLLTVLLNASSVWLFRTLGVRHPDDLLIIPGLIISLILTFCFTVFIVNTLHPAALKGVPSGEKNLLYAGGFLTGYLGYNLIGSVYNGTIYRLASLITLLVSYWLFIFWPELNPRLGLIIN